MYASLQSIAGATVQDFETVSCVVKYNQKKQLDELTVPQIKAAASVDTFIGTKNFVESGANADVECSAFDSFNVSENLMSIDVTKTGWKKNLTETLGFQQDYVAGEFSSVQCSVMSARKDALPRHDFKIGQTMKIKQGYKIRASAIADSSTYAGDSVIKEIALAEKGGAIQVGAILGAAATLAAIVAF